MVKVAHPGQGPRRNFVREWRTHRGLTLEQLSAAVGMDKGNLSKLERGLYPYTQATLEALAEALRTDPASLLVRNPSEPDPIWTIWDKAEPAEQLQILRLAETVLGFRHKLATDS